MGKSAVLTTGLGAPDKVAAWERYIYDTARPAKVIRSLQGSGPVDKELIWDGRLHNGQPAPEGLYWAVMSARYATGQTVYSKYVRLEVNNSVPVADLSLDPSSVNPKASGEAFIPTAFKATLKSGRGIAEWRMEVLDPQGKVFRSLQGEGALPTDSIVWDGKSDQGDALVSGQVYSARLWVKDAIGNESMTQTPVSFRAVFR